MRRASAMPQKLWTDMNRYHGAIGFQNVITGSIYFFSIPDLSLFRVSKWVGKITTDPSHPGHNLFQLLSSGRRHRTLINHHSDKPLNQCHKATPMQSP